jgi:hypothetical protein
MLGVIVLSVVSSLLCYVSLYWVLRFIVMLDVVVLSVVSFILCWVLCVNAMLSVIMLILCNHLDHLQIFTLGKHSLILIERSSSRFQTFALYLFNCKITRSPKTHLHGSAFLISFVINFWFVIIVNSCNVRAFCKVIFRNKLDLFWTTSVLSYWVWCFMVMLGVVVLTVAAPVKVGRHHFLVLSWKFFCKKNSIFREKSWMGR